MREFENHFTTLEQSERLLALGLPADTADCFYKRHLCQKDEYFEEPKVLPDGLTFSSYCGTETGVDEDIYVPCWSVGRLIEIAEIMVGSDTWQDYQQPSVEKPTLVERAVCTIENLCNLIKFDFEKLF